MFKIAKSIDELIGNTPLLELTHIESVPEVKAKLFAKLEYFNPAGSAKDRVAKQMILDAEESGLLKNGSTIIEPTSGNTGIGLAAVGAAKGYRTIIVMPDTMSLERRQLMKAFGAELVLSDGSKGMQGAIDKANELAKSIPNSFIPGQFDNPSNPRAHFLTTGPEIYEDMDGKIDIFVATIGTGGTITGVAKYLKSKNPNIQIIGIEPSNSPFLTKGEKGPHKIQGIGAGFKPSILDTALINQIVTVSDEDAYEKASCMGKKEGFLIGISSGAALHVAIELSKKEENKDKNIVVLFPDSGDRYLSTGIYD